MSIRSGLFLESGFELDGGRPWVGQANLTGLWNQSVICIVPRDNA